MRKTFSIVAFVLMLYPASIWCQAWSGVLSTARASDWTSAGIPGGIPSNSWTQCGSTIAAYTGSAATINSALSSCNGQSKYVLLGAGDFYLSTSINNRGLSNVEIRGSGPTQTRLHWTGLGPSQCQGGSSSCEIGFMTTSGNYSPSPGTVANWTGGYAQGATSITVDNGSAITAGTTMLILDQCDTGFTGTGCSGAATDNGNYFTCQAAWIRAGVGCSYTGSVNAARPNRGQEEVVTAVSCSPACGSSGTTSVTITFANSGWTNAAFCVANSSVAATQPYVTAQSKTAVTFTFPALTGNLFYHCDGN